MSLTWNLWHGCHKISAGCLNCYVYRMDARHARDGGQVYKTQAFDLPVRRDRRGAYKAAGDQVVWTCFTSDFLLPDADAWRPQAWRMMRERGDLRFVFITKRIDRLEGCLPPDWGGGYENVTIGCTCENQDRADARLPVFLRLPIARRFIACEPLLEGIDLSPYLDARVAQVVAGGESGEAARLCRYAWVLSLREQCQRAGVAFHFKQTGANFEKDGRQYRIPRREQHRQAARAGIDTCPLIGWEDEPNG